MFLLLYSLFVQTTLHTLVSTRIPCWCFSLWQLHSHQETRGGFRGRRLVRYGWVNDLFIISWNVRKQCVLSSSVFFFFLHLMLITYYRGHHYCLVFFYVSIFIFIYVYLLVLFMGYCFLIFSSLYGRKVTRLMFYCLSLPFLPPPSTQTLFCFITRVFIRKFWFYFKRFSRTGFLEIPITNISILRPADNLI